MKIRELIPVEVRISMLQTCMNVSGSNFQGKSVPAKKLLEHSYDLYVGMMKQVFATEVNKLLRINSEVKKVPARRKSNELLKKIAKKKK